MGRQQTAEDVATDCCLSLAHVARKEHGYDEVIARGGNSDRLAPGVYLTKVTRRKGYGLI